MPLSGLLRQLTNLQDGQPGGRREIPIVRDKNPAPTRQRGRELEGVRGTNTMRTAKMPGGPQLATVDLYRADPVAPPQEFLVASGERLVPGAKRHDEDLAERQARRHDLAFAAVDRFEKRPENRAVDGMVFDEVNEFDRDRSLASIPRRLLAVDVGGRIDSLPDLLPEPTELKDRERLRGLEHGRRRYVTSWATDRRCRLARA